MLSFWCHFLHSLMKTPQFPLRALTCVCTYITIHDHTQIEYTHTRLWEDIRYVFLMYELYNDILYNKRVSCTGIVFHSIQKINIAK